MNNEHTPHTLQQLLHTTHTTTTKLQQLLDLLHTEVLTHLAALALATTSKRKLSDIVVVSDYCVVVSGVYNCNNQAAKKCVVSCCVLLCVCVSPYGSLHCRQWVWCGGVVVCRLCPNMLIFWPIIPFYNSSKSYLLF